MSRDVEFAAVVWVPWSWDPDEARGGHLLAMAWALERASEVRVKPVLRVHSHANDWVHPSQTHSPYAKVANIVTDRGRPATGPTLVPFAHSMKLVADGMSCANGHALVVEEHPALPLAAWAAELGAINLRSDKVDADPRDPGLAQRVRDLTSSMHNGWNSPPGNSAARHRLPELGQQG